MPNDDLGLMDAIDTVAIQWTDTAGIWSGTPNEVIEVLVLKGSDVNADIGDFDIRFARVNNVDTLIGSTTDFIVDGVDYSTAVHETAEALDSAFNPDECEYCDDLTAALATATADFTDTQGHYGPAGNDIAYLAIANPVNSGNVDTLIQACVAGTPQWIGGFSGGNPEKAFHYLMPTGLDTVDVDLFTDTLDLLESCQLYPRKWYDNFFTGKIDELRVWSTSLPLNVIDQRRRDGVYGYDNLVLHAPFESNVVVDAQGDSIDVQDFHVYSYKTWSDASDHVL